MDVAANRVTGEACARPFEEGLVVLTVPAPVLSAPRLLALARALGEEPITAWSSPELDSEGRVWSFVGWGEAARIEASGPARLSEIRARAARLFDATRERSCLVRDGRVEVSPRAASESAGLLSLRLFGGVSFRPQLDRDGSRRSLEPDVDQAGHPWSAFRDASFTMPRWLYGKSGGSALLRLAVTRDEEAHAIERLTAMRARLESAARSPEEPALGDLGGAIVSDGEAPSTTPEVWRSMVVDALERIRERHFEKVVAAAVRRLVLTEPVEIASVIRRLDAAYPECSRFAIQRGRATFAGASPERLITVRGLRVEADALAGSARRSTLDDAALARALLESDKDRREHALVVSAIEASLRARCRTLHAPEAPIIRTLRNVHHLWTPIAGDLARPLHVLDLVELLHPTPAVSGWPRDAAMAWIASREAAPRGWYAGAVGWFDEAGDGSFAVAIRSGLIQGREAWIYAGAGLVEGSDPDAELAETRLKQAPILAALGLSP